MYTLSSAVQGYQLWVWVGLGLDMTAANRVHVTKVDNSGQQSEVRVGWGRVVELPFVLLLCLAL